MKLRGCIFLSFFFSFSVVAQISSFPYKENFDSIGTVKLPNGWITTTSKSSLGDFTINTSTQSRSAPNCILSTDAKISQSITSPQINFSNKKVSTLEFYERRSSTHNSGLLVEAILNNDTTSIIQIGDTLKNAGANYVQRSILLPALLNNQPDVRFRWRVVGNGTGSTGTIRLDDIFLSVQKSVDLEFQSLRAVPSQLLKGETSTMSATIFNRASAGTFSFTIQINDSVTTNSIIHQRAYTYMFAESESTIIVIPYENISAGKHSLTASLSVAGDEDTTNNVAAASIVAGLPSHTIIANEIMYAPIGDMPEWIECFNTTNDTIDITGWKISDANTNTKATILNSQNVILPHSYFVVANDSSFKNYFTITAPVFIAKFSALNNTTPDAVVLFDNRTIMMDSVFYKPSWNGTNGNTLERIDFAASSTDSTNWKSSAPTPGKENTLAKKDFDIAVVRVAFEKNADGFLLRATLKNVGRSIANAISVSFFYDTNNDSTITNDEYIGIGSSSVISSLTQNDSVVVSLYWKTTILGKAHIIAQALFAQDQRLTNNTAHFFVSNSYMPQSVVINEIMFDPFPNRAEWIEFFNCSNDTIDLQEWRMMDAPTSSGTRTVLSFSKSSFKIFPKEFFVLASDTIFFQQYPHLAAAKNIFIANKDLNLSNSGDDILLLDHTTLQIDSVRYFPKWHLPSLSSTSGRSLERINPHLASNDTRNWSSSVSTLGATPLAANSIYTTALPSNASLTLSPNPFSPDGDGFEDFLSIAYSLPAISSQLRIRIFDVAGRIVRTLANNEPASSAGTILWNGFDDYSQRVRIGMYIIFVEALDNFGGVVQTMKDVAVVATK